MNDLTGLPKLKMYVGGEWVEPASGQYLETVNPFTGEAWALVPRGNAEDADRAVRATRPLPTGHGAPCIPASAGG